MPGVLSVLCSSAVLNLSELLQQYARSSHVQRYFIRRSCGLFIRSVILRPSQSTSECPDGAPATRSAEGFRREHLIPLGPRKLPITLGAKLHIFGLLDSLKRWTLGSFCIFLSYNWPSFADLPGGLLVGSGQAVVL